MNEFKIVLVLNETNRTDRETTTREIHGDNFIMDDGEYAITDADRATQINYWMEERGEDQHASPLELVSYTVESYT